MENPIKMDDLGVPLFLETPICMYISSQVVFAFTSKSTPPASPAFPAPWARLVLAPTANSELDIPENERIRPLRDHF